LIEALDQKDLLVTEFNYTCLWDCDPTFAGETQVGSLHERVILFGAGQNSKLLLETTHFFRPVEGDHFVDSTPEKIGELFMGREVRHPDTLHETSLPVLISAVQNSPLIYDRYLAMGLDEGRLIKGLVI